MDVETSLPPAQHEAPPPEPRVSVYCGQQRRGYQQDAWLARAVPEEADDQSLLGTWATRVGRDIHYYAHTRTALIRGGTTFNAVVCRNQPGGTFRVTGANIGDSMTVLLLQNQQGQWEVQPVTKQHVFANPASRREGFDGTYMTSDFAAIDARLREIEDSELEAWVRQTLQSGGQCYDDLPQQQQQQLKESYRRSFKPSMHWHMEQHPGGTRVRYLAARLRTRSSLGTAQIGTGRSIGDTLYDGRNHADPVMSHQADLSSTETTRQNYQQVYAITASDGLWDELRRYNNNPFLALASLAAGAEGASNAVPPVRSRADLTNLLERVVRESDDPHQDNTTFLITTPDDCEEGPVLQAVLDGHGEKLTQRALSQDLGIDSYAKTALDRTRVTQDGTCETPEAPSDESADVTPAVHPITVELRGDRAFAAVEEVVNPQSVTLHENVERKFSNQVNQFYHQLKFLTVSGYGTEGWIDDTELRSYLRAAMSHPNLPTEHDAYCEHIWQEVITRHRDSRDCKILENSCCCFTLFTLLFYWLTEKLTSCCACMAWCEPDPVVCAMELRKDEVIGEWKRVLDPTLAAEAQEADEDEDDDLDDWYDATGQLDKDEGEEQALLGDNQPS